MPNFRNNKNKKCHRKWRTSCDKRKSSRDEFNDKSTSDDLEIPGFYYDQEKKRYFRLVPGQNNHNPLTSRIVKQKSLLEAARAKERQIKPEGSIVKLLHNQQLNSLSYLSFKSRFFRLKLSKMRCTQKTSINSSVYVDSYPLTECKYLVGSPKSAGLVAACTLQEGGVLIESFSMHSKEVSEVDTASNEKCAELNLQFESIVNIHPEQKITDLCWAEPGPDLQFVLYTTLDFRGNQPTTMNLVPLFHFCNPSQGVDIEGHACHYEFISALWSCAWSNRAKTFAAGGEGYIYYDALERGNLQKIPFDGNCFSLSYDATGNLLFSGSNKGKLACLDVRNSTSAFSVKLCRGLSYLKLLSDENHLLASAFDGKLMQIDLRTQKVVLEYPHHVNDHMKLPFSVDEEANILCSVGQDHVTRLWMLREGTFLKSVVPDNDSLVSEKSQPMSWFSSSWELPQKRKTCLVITSGTDIMLYND